MYKYRAKLMLNQSITQRVPKMFKLLIIAAVATVALGGLLPREFSRLNPYTPNGRIVGGQPVAIEDAPYQVSLQVYGFGFCGGTIIGKEWVLTAAHCAVYSPSIVTVRAGTHQMTSGGNLHKVEQFIKHEKYSTNMYGIPINDVAVIKLTTPFEFDTKKQAIDLFELNEEVIAGTAATITGWGAVKEGGSASSVLQTVDVPVITKKMCSDAYASFGGLPDGQICAAYPQGGKDACQGDSGGPLTVGGRLAGIVSWGNGCARPGYPGVYTEVAAYQDWILKATGL